jgi:hypothetical protein
LHPDIKQITNKKQTNKSTLLNMARTAMRTS